MSKPAGTGRPRPEAQVHARFRIHSGSDIALGPGKADLLHAIREHGSIRAAAQILGMSYMRAWSLIRTMNRCFTSPLVRTLRGGGRRGGAELTEAGDRILALYDRLQSRSVRATRPIWQQILRELKRS